MNAWSPEAKDADERDHRIGVVRQPDDSGGSEDEPHPGASQATTVNSSDNSSTCRRHKSADVVSRQRRAGTADTCRLALPPLVAFSHR